MKRKCIFSDSERMQWHGPRNNVPMCTAEKRYPTVTGHVLQYHPENEHEARWDQLACCGWLDHPEVPDRCSHPRHWHRCHTSNATRRTPKYSICCCGMSTMCPRVTSTIKHAFSELANMETRIVFRSSCFSTLHKSKWQITEKMHASYRSGRNSYHPKEVGKIVKLKVETIFLK